MSNSEFEETSAGAPAPKSHPNGLAAHDALGRYLEADGWFPRPVDGQHAFRAYYKGRNGELRCYAQIRVDVQQFLFYATATIKVPEEARPGVAEFITRANYGMRIGNFELDYADGEVRYKSSLDFEDEPLSDRLIRNTIYPAVQTLDSYLPGLMKVAFGSLTPFEAIQEVEG